MPWEKSAKESGNVNGRALTFKGGKRDDSFFGGEKGDKRFYQRVRRFLDEAFGCW